MLRLEHYDDGKQKCQSHEIRIRDGKFAPSIELDIFSYNPLDICYTRRFNPWVNRIFVS